MTYEELKQRVAELEEGHPEEWPPGQAPAMPGRYWFRSDNGITVVMNVTDNLEAIYGSNWHSVAQATKFGRWLGPAVLPRPRQPERHELSNPDAAYGLMRKLWSDKRKWRVRMGGLDMEGTAVEVIAAAIHESANPHTDLLLADAVIEEVIDG